MIPQLANSQFGVRHVQCFMAFLGIAIAYCLRVNLSVAIVSMTQNSSSSADFPALPWDESMKGTILSSFFWGYCLLQIPAGQLAEKIGPKFLLVAVVFFGGIVTVLTPFAAIHGGFYWMVFSRILQGAAQGFCYPCSNFLLSKWAPTPERGRLFTWVFNGGQFGTLVTMAMAGVLADSRWGWPSVFYVTGSIAILWALAYSYVGANSPLEHTSISEAERKYIISTLPSVSSERKAFKTPWRSIVTSGPLWALLISHCGQNWGFWTLLTQIPSYVNAVFGVNIKKSGFLSALPYASSFIMGFVFSAIGDRLNNRQVLTRTASKKIWNSIALWGPAVALCLLAFAGDYEVLALSLLVVAVALNSAVNLGYLSNHLDLSPNFAGTLMGITNGLSNITSISAPLFAGFVVKDPRSLLQWQIVFLTSAGIFFIGNLVFIIFGTAEVQPWNSPRGQRESESEPEASPRSE
nr:PREDICTED: putative inorganic phosphate cotransporter isoform X3 [Bemisia tabaci]